MALLAENLVSLVQPMGGPDYAPLLLVGLGGEV